MIPTPPLRLRNRLAATILAALHDEGARRELAALARGAGAVPDGWLAEDGAQWAGLVVERARRAHEALADRPLLAPDVDLRAALEAAATLFDAGLYFEVHEVLEPHWAAAEGETRGTLQGLIQVAVGYQHVANSNLAGARSLFEEGCARLHHRRLAGAELEPLARAAAACAEGLGSGPLPPAPRFPRPR